MCVISENGIQPNKKNSIPRKLSHNKTSTSTKVKIRNSKTKNNKVSSWPSFRHESLPPAKNRMRAETLPYDQSTHSRHSPLSALDKLIPSSLEKNTPPSATAAAAGGDKEGVKKKRAPPQQRKKKKSLVGNFLSDMVKSIIKSELENLTKNLNFLNVTTLRLFTPFQIVTRCAPVSNIVMSPFVIMLFLSNVKKMGPSIHKKESCFPKNFNKYNLEKMGLNWSFSHFAHCPTARSQPGPGPVRPRSGSGPAPVRLRSGSRSGRLRSGPGHARSGP